MLKKIYRELRWRLEYGVSSLLVDINGLKKNTNINLENCHNKYKGKKCFVIGNGPSLTIQDLEKLENEYTFASNKIYKLFDKTSWRPNFYAVFDESVGASEGTMENADKIECEYKFFRKQGYYVYKKMKNRKNLCYLKSFHSRKYLDDPQFSLDLKQGVYTIGTVTYAMLQIAIWMGFTEIYLLGLDNNYSVTIDRNNKIHVDPSVKDYAWDNKNVIANPVWEQNVAFDYAEIFSKDHGFKIYNATRGGKLESFERIDFDKIFENK